MPTEKEIQKRAEILQTKMHNYAVEVQRTLNPLSYSDIKEVCIFRKLAELELKIEENERQIYLLTNI